MIDKTGEKEKTEAERSDMNVYKGLNTVYLTTLEQSVQHFILGVLKVEYCPQMRKTTQRSHGWIESVQR